MGMGWLAGFPLRNPQHHFLLPFLLALGGFSRLGEPDVIGDHVEVVPGKELLLQGVVVDHAAVLVAVLERDHQGLAATGAGVVCEVDGSIRQ